MVETGYAGEGYCRIEDQPRPHCPAAAATKRADAHAVATQRMLSFRAWPSTLEIPR